MEKFLYIVNPKAGNENGKKSIPKIESYCNGKNINYKIISTEYPLHATKIAKEQCKNYSHVIAVGGDGTVNEIINGILHNKEITFAAVQIGTGNDLIKNYKYPGNIDEMLEVIHNIEMQNIITIDVGKVTYTNGTGRGIKEHYFVNNLGIGFDAYVGYLNLHNKKINGVTSYVLAVLKALINYKMIDVKIQFNEIRIAGKKLMLTIGNGISSGGGFYLTPRALIDDNLLDISVFDKVSRLKLLNVLPKALLNKLETVKEAQMYKSKKISIELKEPYFVHCDGEIISKGIKTAEVECLPNELKIITMK